MGRWRAVLLGGAGTLLLAAGLARAAVEPVALRPLLDRPARLVVHEAFSPVGADHAALIVVNFGSQRLKASGDIIHAGRAAPQGNLRDYLATLHEPWRFNFYEVRSDAGEVLGYFLAHPDVSDSFFLDQADGHLYARGEFMGIGGE